jgi:exopolyphosphatase/guanosine-5'-triphosphate,3'-diphosphate pyrophosphatase
VWVPYLNTDKEGDNKNGSDAYAAIDLGTNNCRLLIAQPSHDGFNVVDGFSRIVRLGEGVVTSNQLNPDAMGRTLNALRACAQKLNNWNIKRIRCVATEACRQAKNSAGFITRVKDETGLPFEIITSDLEAYLTLQGCIPLLNPKKPKILLLDIGGGSTEVTWAEIDGPLKPRILGILSLPMGVVTLSETYGIELLKSEIFDHIYRDLIRSLTSFCHQHNILDEIELGQVQMIGTSGTVTTLGALSLGLKQYKRSRVDGLWMSFEEINSQISNIITMDIDTLHAIPCIGAERASLMIMGCALLNAIFAKWPVGELRAADRGIREGLLLDMIDKDRHDNVNLENL